MTKTTFIAWIKAARLRTLALALSGTFIASAIAFEQQQFRFTIFAFTMVTTLLLQILSNFANDYGDYKHGTDNVNRVGPLRAVQSGAISENQMKKAVIGMAVLSLISGLLLLYIALFSIINYVFILFFIAGIAAIAAAVKYTIGANAFGYKGLGDVMVFLFFGIAAVSGTHFLYTLHFNAWVLMPAAAIGLLSAGVLNVNNLRDVDNDRQSGKITLVVRFGARFGRIYHTLLIGTAVLLIMVYLAVYGKYYLLFSMVIPLIPLTLHIATIHKTTHAAALDPELKRLSLSTLLLSGWVSAGINL